MPVVEVHHPLVRHKLGLMRKKNISSKDFRELAAELASLLIYEATKGLETETQTVEGWAGPVEIEQIKGKKITVVPILRAGLGMLNGVLDLIPGAKVSVVGLYRDEGTLQPVGYFKKLARGMKERTALIIDPMLATGGSLNATVDLLREAGCTRITAVCLVAAPEGINKVQQSHPELEIYVASIDRCLNDQGYILPGLGDAGDKIFGTK